MGDIFNWFVLLFLLAGLIVGSIHAGYYLGRRQAEHPRWDESLGCLPVVADHPPYRVVEDDE